MRSETLCIAFDALGALKTPWVRLFAAVVPYVKTGDRLDAVESAWLGAWLSDRGMGGADESEVHTVQIPIDWAANLFNWHPQTVQRAIAGIVDAGVFEVVRKGIRGHATLYCVMPLPSRSTNNDVRGNAVTRHERGCEGNGIVENSDTLTFRPEYPHISSEIPSHRNSATCGDASVTIVNQNKPRAHGADAGEPAPHAREEGKAMESVRLGDRCPDPKEQGCSGTVCRITDFVEKKRCKHPSWLMCDRCKARFDEYGTYVDPSPR